MLSQDIPSLPGISHAFTGFPMHSQYFQVFGEIWSVISPLRYQKVLAFEGEHRIGCSNLVSVFAQGLQKVFLQKVAQLRLFLIAVQNKSQNTTCKQLDLGNVTLPGEFD